MASDVEMRKLTDLRVVDLKIELDKRGLETTGIKSILYERLFKALEEEGHDPQEFIFEVSKHPLLKKFARDVEKESELHESEVPVKDQNISTKDNNYEKHNNPILEDSDKYFLPSDKLDVEEAQITEDIAGQKGNKNDNADNDDSLNLTIGEEDEKLFSDDIPESIHGEKNDVQNSVDEANKAENTDPKTVITYNTSVNVKESEKGPEESQENTSKTTSKFVSSHGRNLWISGLSQQTRATDLKQLFSKFGKVVGAKVVTNTRTPGTRCYGYVTMASVKDATECIEHLHRTELHGRLISVERAKSDLGPPKTSSSTRNTSGEKERSSSSCSRSSKRLVSDKQSSRKDTDKQSNVKDVKNSTADDSKIEVGRMEKEENEALKESCIDQMKQEKVETERTQTIGEKEIKEISSSKHKSSIKKNDDGKFEGISVVKNRGRDRRDRRRSRSNEILSFEKIREERERQRLRQKERELREDERRRREISRRQRDEDHRLAREREKLALERARIEKEKVELLRLERERQKLEREKIELERLELKRQQRKIEEAKRAIKRPSDDRYDDADRKRSLSERDRRFEAPPPPRFDSSLTNSRSTYDRLGDKKRIDEYASKRDDFRDLAKGSTYDRSSGSVTYKEGRASRDDRPNKPRYEGYDRSNGGSTVWNQSQQAQPFNSIQSAVGIPEGNAWRNIDTGHDRYDRYNSERKVGAQSVGYMESPRQQYIGGTAQDRFGNPVGRVFEGRRF